MVWFFETVNMLSQQHSSSGFNIHPRSLPESVVTFGAAKWWFSTSTIPPAFISWLFFFSFFGKKELTFFFHSLSHMSSLPAPITLSCGHREREAWEVSEKGEGDLHDWIRPELVTLLSKTKLDSVCRGERGKLLLARQPSISAIIWEKEKYELIDKYFVMQSDTMKLFLKCAGTQTNNTYTHTC